MDIALCEKDDIQYVTGGGFKYQAIILSLVLTLSSSTGSITETM